MVNLCMIVPCPQVRTWLWDVLSCVWQQQNSGGICMQGQFEKLQAGLHVTVSTAIAVESLITVIIQMIAKAISGFQWFLWPFSGQNPQLGIKRLPPQYIQNHNYTWKTLNIFPVWYLNTLISTVSQSPVKTKYNHHSVACRTTLTAITRNNRFLCDAALFFLDRRGSLSLIVLSYNMATEVCRVWDIALKCFCLFVLNIISLSIVWFDLGTSTGGIVFTHTQMLQTSKLPRLTPADDQLIACIWSATSGCCLPS